MAEKWKPPRGGSFTWVEIPVNDMDRAKGFYSQVFNWTFAGSGTDDSLMINRDREDQVRGAIVRTSENLEHKVAPLVYLYSHDIDKHVAAIEKHGGKIVKSKYSLANDRGIVSVFQDTEGNKLALYHFPSADNYEA
ncbi:hypothetical protein SpCBS45565_g03244 [Spizellomyces sp. 'palustris']|nr:hypothetical protein SpCBS45565_g03244 [Spizellomyces sp. 'palustris']